jgi:hypothetical protein
VPDRNLPRLSRRMPGMPEAPPVRMVHLRGHGAPVKDHAVAAAQAAAADPDLTAAVGGVLRTLDPDLPADPELVETICGRVDILMSREQHSGSRGGHFGG